jgi:menaquinone-dependent protoporphyrinogen IX oxidase
MESVLRVLVGYASCFGSTRDIATRIAATVRTHSADVDVRSAETIMSFDSYDAVVFGSGVYDGGRGNWAGTSTRTTSQSMMSRNTSARIGLKFSRLARILGIG